jgi:hypothetical protein
LNWLSLSHDEKSYTFESPGLQLVANGLQLNAELLNDWKQKRRRQEF